MAHNGLSKKLCIIDDEDYWLNKVEKIIEDIDELECLYTAQSVPSFMKEFKATKESFYIFLDINFDGDKSLKHIRDLLKKYPTAEIILFTVLEYEEFLFTGLLQGASGYLIKEKSEEKLKKQFRSFLEIGAVLSPFMARKLIQYFNPNLSNFDAKVSTIENTVLQLLAEGWSYKQIANRTETPIDNIRYYVKKIYKKFNVNSQVELIRKNNDIKKPTDN